VRRLTYCLHRHPGGCKVRGVSTTDEPIDRTGRRFDLVHADYFHGVAEELIEGDGFRILAAAGRRVPAEYVGALVVTRVSTHAGLIGIEFVDRASHVSDVLDAAMFDLPAAATPMVGGTVFAPGERVLIRG
jgi:hypothetical protein